MKTTNLINLAVGGAVLFGTVWLVSKAWSKGQADKSKNSDNVDSTEDLSSDFAGNTAQGFANLNRGISPRGVASGNTASCPPNVQAQGNCEKQCDNAGGVYNPNSKICSGFPSGVSPYGRRTMRVATR